MNGSKPVGRGWLFWFLLVSLVISLHFYDRNYAQSSIYNTDQFMERERQRKSVRYINSCTPVPNIFRLPSESEELLTLIPKSILSKINQTSSISCQNIASLPQFQDQGEMQEKLRMCSLAGQYQLAWQEQLAPSSLLVEKPTDVWHSTPIKETLHPVQQLHTTPTPPRPPPKRREQLWKDEEFLDRLNQFIAEDPFAASRGFPPEDFFQK